MIKDILQRSEAMLRQKAKLIPLAEIGTARMSGIIADMAETMAGQKDGIVIAAPQIGIPLRLFVVSGSLLKQADKGYTGPADTLVFINPEIVKRSREKSEVEEGCLSVRWLYGMVKRATRVTIKAYDERGERFERGASGLLAQIFQHECDHLDGVLFIDRAHEVWEMTEQEIADLQKK